MYTDDRTNNSQSTQRLLGNASASSSSSVVQRHWLPSRYEEPVIGDDYHPRRAASFHQPLRVRSFRRLLFLILTEPDTSVASAVFFVILVVTISVQNAVMIAQTMPAWQWTPDDCRSCGGSTSYLFDDDDSIMEPASGIACRCPPTPLPWTSQVLTSLVYFFTVEWTLRVLCFEPATPRRWWLQWWQFLTSWSTVLDALAIFPYYIEMSFSTNGLMSLRLLRLFRVFQLVRLGQYNDTFKSLMSVLFQSALYLKLLLGVLLMGAAFFGSIMYWLEKGDWRYHAATGNYRFVREQDGDLSPFTSIPAAFWWFLTTATTVGYGDVVPTSTAGKWVAAAAMLTGVLVVAFPVSVFSELWQKELRRTGAFAELMNDDDDDDVVVAPPAKEPLSPKTYGAVNDTRPTPNDHVLYSGASLETSYYQSDADYIRMHRNDLAEIVAGLASIAETQREIKSILRKYNR